MNKDPKIFLRHIIESIEWIEAYSKNLTKEDFFKSQQVQDALIRRVEIIGEAVKNLPGDFKEKHPSIPWQEIAGMRDVLIHEYFGVALNQVWVVISEDVPRLKQYISKIL